MEVENLKVTVIVLCMILSTIAVSADVNVQVDNTFNIIAGNSETLNLTMTSSKKITVHLSYHIKPDGVGFDITFEDNDFTFKGTKIIDVNVSTDELLAPNNYVILIDYSYVVKSTGGSGGGTVVIRGGNNENKNTDTDEIDNEIDVGEESDTITDDNENNTAFHEKQKDDKGLLILGIILLFILFLIIIWKRKKDKEEQ